MPQDKKTVLKKIIKKLHEGAEPSAVKDEFSDVLRSTTSAEISHVEEELIREGMPRERIQKLCDLHLELFRESLEANPTLAPEWHPVSTLMKEHEILLASAEELHCLASSLKTKKSEGKTKLPKMLNLVHLFRDSESHYLREENVLFPSLERHGVTEPPKVMWMDHDQIRALKKQLYALAADDDAGFLRNIASIERIVGSLKDLLSNHFYKENNILYPTGLKVIPDDEWVQIREQFDELGYCSFTPRPAAMPATVSKTVSMKPETSGEVSFETGNMPREVLEVLLDTLPVDITFVDEQDCVRYFSQSKERIFVRTKSVIGRQVQLCHPQKSVHVVNKILDDFRNGRRSSADFWINLNGRLIYIRYLALRSPDGKYLGCLEVTQDITDIKNIEGQKRLLDNPSE